MELGNDESIGGQGSKRLTGTLKLVSMWGNCYDKQSYQLAVITSPFAASCVRGKYIRGYMASLFRPCVRLKVLHTTNYIG